MKRRGAGLKGSEAVGAIVRTTLERAGLNPEVKRPHLLHHSLGTNYLTGGLLRRFVVFADREAADLITTELALKWAAQPSRAHRRNDEGIDHIFRSSGGILPGTIDATTLGQLAHSRELPRCLSWRSPCRESEPTVNRGGTSTAG
jgi:hypothetical protein